MSMLSGQLLWAFLLPYLGRNCESKPGHYAGLENMDGDSKQIQQAKWVLERVILRNQNGAWKNLGYYEDVVTFINAYFPPTVVVNWLEIGTAYGGLTNHVLSQRTSLNATVVDPFMLGYDALDKKASHSFRMRGWADQSHMTPDEFSSAWANGLLHQQRKNHGCRYSMIKALSNDGAQFIPDQSLDVLFIDGLHTYEGVKNDLHNYWPKLKSQSLLIFNDWTSKFPDVAKAGCEFLESKGWPDVIIGRRQSPPGFSNTAVVIGMTSQHSSNHRCERR